MNRSRIAAAVCVPLTSNLVWANAPGNTLIPAKAAGLPKDSVANASQIITLDRGFLTDRVGRLPPQLLDQILYGPDVVLGGSCPKNPCSLRFDAPLKSL